MKFVNILTVAVIACALVPAVSSAQLAKPGMVDSVSKQMRPGNAVAKKSTAKSGSSASTKSAHKSASAALATSDATPAATPAAKAATAADSSKPVPAARRSPHQAKKKPPVK